MSKFCYYLRHIDVLAVYQQLQSYKAYWGENARLANIQPQFCDTLSVCFEEAAEAIETLINVPWQDMKAIHVAAEVGDFIEDAIEKLYSSTEELLPNTEDSTRDILDKFSSMQLTDSYEVADYWQLNALLIYQYDYLCWLIQREAFSETFEMFEMIAETRCRIQSILVAEHNNKLVEMDASRRAAKLAAKRHAPTNEIKARLLAEWDETSGKYSSRAAFSSAVARREGMRERTLYEWIAKHEKSK